MRITKKKFQNQRSTKIEMSRKSFNRGDNMRHGNLMAHWHNERYIPKAK